jgi:pyridoxine 5-phosphate synthase
MIRLGVNVDHVATVRQARGETYPSPVQAASLCETGGADNITCHLREDRRHINDNDASLLRATINIPLNFEMACTPEMLAFALKLKPHSVTLVPEKREERTTEGGLNVAGNFDLIAKQVDILQKAGILACLFIEPESNAVKFSAKTGAKAVEFHTGKFCKQIDHATTTKDRLTALHPVKDASILAHELGMQCHFGHGLHYGNANWLQLVDYAEEANIGHSIVARAIFCGLEKAVTDMKSLLNDPKFRPYIG